MKKIIVLFLASAFVFTLGGCSLKKTDKAAEMPADKPWNREVMETDNGYYYNVCEWMHSMRYSEKSNYADIFLCAKPECDHKGEDTCTATFNFLESTNHILYEGAVYFATESYEKDSLSYSVYQESLDGTSLDKLCDIFKVKYPSEKLEGWGMLDDIIIHKGYAYVPYNMGHSNTYSDFVGSGLAKVNISTGKSENIFSTDKFAESAKVKLYAGVGDYVYYRSESSVSDRNGFLRYNINDGSIEKIKCDFGEKLCDSIWTKDGKIEEDSYSMAGITEKAFYVIYKNGNVCKLTGYDAKTLEPDGFEIDMTVDRKFHARAAVYDDKIFVFDMDEIKVYSDKGEQLGSHKWRSYLMYDGETTEFSDDTRKFDFSDGKLYIGYDNPYNYEKDEFIFDSGEYETDSGDKGVFGFFWYSCPIEDVISGKGKWKKAYIEKNSSVCWGEFYPAPKYVKQYIYPKYEVQRYDEY